MLCLAKKKLKVCIQATQQKFFNLILTASFKNCKYRTKLKSKLIYTVKYFDYKQINTN